MVSALNKQSAKPQSDRKHAVGLQIIRPVKFGLIWIAPGYLVHCCFLVLKLECNNAVCATSASVISFFLQIASTECRLIQWHLLILILQ